MAIVNIRECKAAGVDYKKVESISRRISRAAKEAAALGIVVFGGAGSGSLRFRDRPDELVGPLILAHLDGTFDGGDGACSDREDGFERGE